MNPPDLHARRGREVMFHRRGTPLSLAPSITAQRVASLQRALEANEANPSDHWKGKTRATLENRLGQVLNKAAKGQDFKDRNPRFGRLLPAERYLEDELLDNFNMGERHGRSLEFEARRFRAAHGREYAIDRKSRGYLESGGHDNLLEEDPDVARQRQLKAEHGQRTHAARLNLSIGDPRSNAPPGMERPYLQTRLQRWKAQLRSLSETPAEMQERISFLRDLAEKGDARTQQQGVEGLQSPGLSARSQAAQRFLHKIAPYVKVGVVAGATAAIGGGVKTLLDEALSAREAGRGSTTPGSWDNPIPVEGVEVKASATRWGPETLRRRQMFLQQPSRPRQ